MLVAGGVAVAMVLVVALVLVLRDTPGAQLARAVETTFAEGTAAASVTGTVRELPFLGDLTLSVADGHLDFDRERASLRRELPFVSGLDVPGIGAVGDVELVYADGSAWLRGPFDTERAWVHVRDGSDEAVTAPGLGNPLALLALIRAIEGAPEELDDEPVAGIDTTRYRVLVDLDALEGRVAEPSHDLLDNLRRLHEDDRLPMDVWVDEDDLIRRVRYEVDVDLPSLPSFDLGTEVELTDHGVPVAIDPPDDSEVTDISADRLREVDPIRILRDALEQLPFIGD